MSNELQHHGVKGMHWGVRRYQNKDGTRTAAGKKRYRTDKSSGSNNKKTANTKKSRISSLFSKKPVDTKKQEASKALTEKQKQDAYEAAKEKAVKSGSAAEVLKYQGKLTPQEMQYAMSRIQWEQNMKGIADKDAGKGAEKYIKNLNRAVDVVTTTSKAYNTFANIYNAFSGTDKRMLPKIELDNSKGNRAQRRAEEKERKKAEKEAKEVEKENKKEEKQSKDKTYDTKAENKTYDTDDFNFKSKSKPNVYEVDFKDVSDTKVNSTSYKETKSAGQNRISSLLESSVGSSKTSTSNESFSSGQNYIAGLLPEKAGR